MTARITNAGSQAHPSVKSVSTGASQAQLLEKPFLIDAEGRSFVGPSCRKEASQGRSQSV